MLGRPILVVDVETTGRDPACDSIIEIGACLLRSQDLLELDRFYSRVRPSSPIRSGAFVIHGLTKEMLANEPEIEIVLQQFLAFSPRESIVAGHNVAFDVAFIRAALARHVLDYPFDYHTIDLWSIAYVDLLARGELPQTLSLDTLCTLYGIPRSAHHNAMEDAAIAARILKELLARIQEGGIRK